MPKSLVIVESPTKVRTLKKYLGKEYAVEATVGHIMDLPKNEIGIDMENGFAPLYKTIPGKTKVVASLKKAAGPIQDIFLAPDPDREGEAIAWHVSQVLAGKGRVFHRVLFHELTKNAILKAMSEPKDLDQAKYDAQKARRALDRLVGYEVSPLLWRKVKGGLSAGRVQSVAVRIICERERAIQAFLPEEYWTIDARLLGPEPPEFAARLAKKNGAKLSIPDSAHAQDIVQSLAGLPFVVDKVVKKRVNKNPLPPFTTSKLQQEAIRKLHFSAKKTMSLAQELYEGIDLGPGEPVGLITYMRTDSTRIAQEAALEALDFIGEAFGPEYRPPAPRFFKNKKKVQDAHEAIRPTSVHQTPEKMAPFLSRDLLALYRLIWQRFVASQMQPALMDKTTVTVAAGPFQFTATGSVTAFKGFLALYQSADDAEDDKESKLPALEQGMDLQCLGLDPRQHFTQAPPRFSEATLVKELEENGIGRPSTYATILSTIRDKNYVDLVGGYFRPSELGFIVNDLLVANFRDIFGVSFTAGMEDNLDKIETSQARSGEILEAFYRSFKADLENATQHMVSIKGVGVFTGLACPKCSKPLHIKIGKNGPFLACSGYPDCRFTSNYTRDEKGNIQMEQVEETQDTGQVCEKCGLPMALRKGRFGPFLACTGYPQCKNTRSQGSGQTALSTGVPCPEKGCGGQMLEKRSKMGKTFYGCSRYPDCTYALWDKPVAKPCPECGSPFLVEKESKKAGKALVCPSKECRYKEPL